MQKRYILNATIEFSPEERQLSVCGTHNPVVKLNAPVSRCLELLIERRYSLVPQQVFYTYVWGDDGAQVTANTLYQNIGLLRKALKTLTVGGDNIVTTVPKKGFALAPQVTVQEISEDDPVEVLSSVSLVGNVDAGKTVHDVLAPNAKRVALKLEHARNKKGMLIILFVFVLILSSGVIFQLIQWGVPSSTAYLSKFQHKTTVSDCQVFTNHVVKNIDRVKENIAASQIDCAKVPYVYMTGYQYSHIVSLLSCEQPLGGTTVPKCSVNTIVRNTEK